MDTMSRLRDSGRAAAAGILAGAAGTLAMSAVMLAGGRIGVMGTQPPRRVIDEAAEHGAPAGRTDRSRDVAAAALHVVIGSAAGVVEFALVRLLPWPRRGRASRGAAGAAFGLAMWALNYVALAPALGILPPPPKDRPGRPILMIAAHVVFGAVSAEMGAVIDRMLAGPQHRETSVRSVLGLDGGAPPARSFA